MTEPVSSSLLTCRDLIQSIVAAVDARDVYTAHHSDRVAAMAVVLARVLHLSETTPPRCRLPLSPMTSAKFRCPTPCCAKPGR